MPFFHNAEGVAVSGGIFIDIDNVYRKGEGIKVLLDSYVQREAIHDSDARGALGCHPGTREEYIRNITSWGTGEWESEKRAFLMIGQAGTGKSAIARTCAHNLKAAGNLGASFFFFRPSGWNDPKKFIPTIVYQLATRYPAYRDCIDVVILNDPLVLEKAMDIQFWELLVEPLRKLSVDDYGIVGKNVVIIVDGLDECATVEAQVQIVNLIGASIREQTTPYMWAIFSRPEPPITSAFLSNIPTNIPWELPLKLSHGNANSDIEAYLRGSFQVIRTKYNIPATIAWPMEGHIRRLISQSAGLFIYAVTAIRYIDGLGTGTPGLDERLHAVLQLDSKLPESPFSTLDQLYILVMMQIPEGVLSNTMSLLHLDQSIAVQKYDRALTVSSSKARPKVVSYCFALGLSSAAFHVAISNLYSILEVTKSPSASGTPESFLFYHRSFLDFLLDKRRSKQYFIKSPVIQQHYLGMIVRTMGTVLGPNANGEFNGDTIDTFTVQAFFTLVEEHDGELEEDMLRQISQANWQYWRSLYPNCYAIDFRTFIQKIPKSWRPKIVRPSHDGLLGIPLQVRAILRPKRYEAEAYILGNGDKKGLIVKTYYSNGETFDEFQ